MGLGGQDAGLYFLGQWQAAARRTVRETRLAEMPQFMVDLPQSLVETPMARWTRFLVEFTVFSHSFAILR
jgi:hypothetical protein